MTKGWVKLTDGKFLLKDFGKYRTDLLIISDKPEINYERVAPQDFNLEEGSLDFLRGSFFVTKKGANAFKIEEEGKHLLLRDDWGGAFNSYRGKSLFKLENLLYKRRAASNGGGTGYDYVVVPVGSTYKISIEDL